MGLYNYNGPAILNAVRAAGKAGKVKIVCFDENDETLEGVASGDIHGTVVQQPYEFGKQAITRMAKHLAGDTDALSGGKQIVPTRSLKKDDVAAFQLADLPSPGKFGVFYDVDRPTKNALEQKWIDDTQAKLAGMSQRDILRKRFETMR